MLRLSRKQVEAEQAPRWQVLLVWLEQQAEPSAWLEARYQAALAAL